MALGTRFILKLVTKYAKEYSTPCSCCYKIQ